MYLAHNNKTIVDHFVTIHITFESAHWCTPEWYYTIAYDKRKCLFLTSLCHGSLWYFPKAHGQLLRICLQNFPKIKHIVLQKKQLC